MTKIIYGKTLLPFRGDHTEEFSQLSFDSVLI